MSIRLGAFGSVVGGRRELVPKSVTREPSFLLETQASAGLSRLGGSIQPPQQRRVVSKANAAMISQWWRLSFLIGVKLFARLRGSES